MDRAICGVTELKFADPANGSSLKFSGYGAVFGNVDAYGDVIDKGAFAAWLADVKAGRQSWPAMLSQHGGIGLTAEDLTPVGVFTHLEEDGTGLKFDGELADTPRGRELYTLLKMKPRPAIDGMSISYIAKDWTPRTKPEEPRRRLKRIDVVEISLVSFPANRRARVTGIKSIRDFEAQLRDVLGFSKREASALASRGWSALGDRDDRGEDLEALHAAIKATTNSFQRK